MVGFGGGAMVGSPLAIRLMDYFHTPTDVGVTKTFLTMGTFYLVFMVFGALIVRLPEKDWKPEGWTPRTSASGLISAHSVRMSPLLCNTLCGDYDTLPPCCSITFRAASKYRRITRRSPKTGTAMRCPYRCRQQLT